MKPSIKESSEGYELACGCKCELINGKYITILCDQHEEEQEEMLYEPKHFTKFRTSREI